MRRAAVAFWATLALAGCAESEEILRTIMPRQAAPVAAPAPSQQSSEPTPAERAAQALGRQPAADPSLAAIPPPRVGPDPARLAGMVPAQLTDLLGQPSLKRREREAEVWMYSSRLCTLHLFLYPGADGGALGVKHFEVRRPNSNTPVAPRDCLDSVIARKPRAS
jgi:hypothetical protein